MKRTFLTIALVAFGLGSTARADITWTFSPPGPDTGPSCAGPNPRCSVGNSFTYTSGGVSIVASGFYNNGNPQGLYEKNRSGDTGLGFSQPSLSEIDTSGYVQLDLSTLNGVPKLDPIALVLGSLSPNQQYDVYTFTSDGAAPVNLAGYGTVFAHNQGTTGFLPGGYSSTFETGSKVHTYIAITASATNPVSDLVLTSLSLKNSSGVNPTPEPGFYGILLVAISALALPQVRRRFIPERS
jgi:hypothetical protein